MHAASKIGGMLELLLGNALSFAVKALVFKTLYYFIVSVIDQQSEHAY